MVHYHNVEQGSKEWDLLRSGMLTASKATPIGANGAGLKTYCKQIVLEKLGVVKDGYYGDDMVRGDELEPTARMAYELEMGVDVVEVGGITNDKFVGLWMSPDGLIGENGGAEIKARNDEKHLSLILGEDKEISNNQIQFSLMVSEREWWDFVSFNPNFTKPLFIKRIYPDLVYFEKLKLGFYNGKKLIKQYTEEYENFKN